MVSKYMVVMALDATLHQEFLETDPRPKESLSASLHGARMSIWLAIWLMIRQSA